jgi:iron-sulfur cluster assembly protein
MLTLTPAATKVVNTVAEAYGTSETGGLRITGTEDVGLEVEFVAGPGDRDQVLVQGGARVFLEPEAAAYLTDKVLDGDMDDEGRVRLNLGQQDGVDGQEG